MSWREPVLLVPVCKPSYSLFCWQNYLWRVNFKLAGIYVCQLCRQPHSVRQQKHYYAIHVRIHSTNWRKFFPYIDLD